MTTKLQNTTEMAAVLNAIVEIKGAEKEQDIVRT